MNPLYAVRDWRSGKSIPERRESWALGCFQRSRAGLVGRVGIEPTTKGL